MTYTIIILVVLGLFFGYLFSWQTIDLSDIYTDKPIYLGHRGDRLNYPENTIASYRSAIEKGFDGVELDVMMTKDGKLVCSHNFDLERETDGNGFIDEINYQDLANVKAGRQFSSEKQQSIPLFLDVVKILPKDVILNIEIKARYAFDLKTAIAVARLIKAKEITQKIIVSSFNPLAIRMVKIISSQIPTGYIYKNEKHFKGIYIAQSDCLHPDAELVTNKTVKFSKKRGLRINAWTVNNTETHDWLIEKGIDGIITDHSELIQAD